MRRPQNLPLPFTAIYVTLTLPTPPYQNPPPFLQCNPPRIYISLPEYNPLSYNYMRPSQNLPLSHIV